MASITYSIKVSPIDTIFQGGDEFTASLTRDGTPPSGAYPVSAVVKFTKIKVHSSKKPYIQFGDYFTTEGLPSASGEFLQVSCTSLSSEILDVSSATITATVKGIGSTNGFDFDSSSVTLVVEYAVSSSTSGFSLASSSVAAGNSLSVSFSNQNISNVYHVVKWAFGSYSYQTQTSYGSTSASHTIPMDWVNAIPSSTSGTGTVTVGTYSSSGLLGSSSKNFT